MNKRALLPALLCAFTSSSFASDWDTRTVTWTEENPLSTLTFMMKGEDIETIKVVGAEISHSKQGTQRLYLSFIEIANDNSCDPQNTPDNVVVRVNGQPINMHQACELADGMALIQTTALSDKGVEFMMNAFSNSPDTVQVEYRSFKADVSAVGFTKSWNQSGGDAL
ncbi:hypothetical protein C9J01_08095 [Photobacterium rosenbergii]|uniref:Uncharacterized protein n=1 Tax=Photobacterium rosenbergii TaxID=294936 RepID=A0A2T3NHC0_9GAMM|nr:hypothetical protein [Photobacterium rosenbergii]PSW14389.1 hypothetical protein C9J01_08095 [Photobacterium rosenbergii]